MDYAELETIKFQTRAAYGCMAVGESPWARAWTVAYVCDIQRRCSKTVAVCGSWHYVSVMLLSLFDSGFLGKGTLYITV